MKSTTTVTIIVSIIIVILLTAPIFPLTRVSNLVQSTYPPTEFKYEVAHFVYGLWDDSDIPNNFSQTMDMWRKQGWKVKLWNKQMFNELLAKYPKYTKLHMKRNVQLADLARLLILYDEGGHYFDLDCIPVGPKDITLLQHLQTTNPPVIFYVEMYVSYLTAMSTIRHKIRNNIPETIVRIANYAFGSHPQNPAILANLELLRKRCLSHPDKNSDYDILYKSGPDCTTTAVNNYKGPKAVVDRKGWMKHLVAGTWRDNKDITST